MKNQLVLCGAFNLRFAKSLLFLLLLLCMGAHAFATTYFWRAQNAPAASVSSAADPFTICQSAATYWHVTYDHATYMGASDGRYQCFSATGYYDFAYRTGDSCAAGTTLNTATGLCASPCPSGTVGTVAWPSAYVDRLGHQVGSLLTQPLVGQSIVNVGSCQVRVTGLHQPADCKSVASDPYPQLVKCTYDTSMTGDASTSSTPAVPTPTPPNTTPDTNNKCPSGTTNIGTDPSGIPICAGQGTPETTKSSTGTTTSTTNPDGSTTKTTTDTSKNADGSTTTKTTTTTTGTDGSVSTTSSTSTGVNGIGKPGVSDSDRSSDLCALHPELNVCNNSTVSGSGKNYSCTGDAIQCATLRELGKALDDTPTPNSTLGGQITTGQDPLKATLPSPSNGPTLNVNTDLDTSGTLGGGSCLTDRSYSLLGQSFVVPFSKVCDYLIWFRYIMMLMAGLVSYRIVAGAVIGTKS